jgi:LysR family tcuABC transcriptional regulator
MSRMNYLYSLPPEKLSPCAGVVRDELKLLVRRLIESGEWQGVRLSQDAAVPDEQAEEALA